MAELTQEKIWCLITTIHGKLRTGHGEDRLGTPQTTEGLCASYQCCEFCIYIGVGPASSDKDQIVDTAAVFSFQFQEDFMVIGLKFAAIASWEEWR